MKTVLTWFRILMGTVVITLSAVFLAIEGIRLCIGDHLLYDLSLSAMLQIILRCGLSAGSLVFGLFTVRGRVSVWSCICLMLCTLVTAPFLSNGFGLYFPLIAALTLFSVFADQRRKKQQ